MRLMIFAGCKHLPGWEISERVHRRVLASRRLQGRGQVGSFHGAHSGPGRRHSKVERPVRHDSHHLAPSIELVKFWSSKFLQKLEPNSTESISQVWRRRQRRLPLLHFNLTFPARKSKQKINKKLFSTLKVLEVVLVVVKVIRKKVLMHKRCGIIDS